MYSFNCCFIPIDQTKRPAFKTCIIHCSYDKSWLISHILKKDLDPLKYLLKATTIKSYGPLLYSLAENTKEGEIPQVIYHRKCRGLFRMKRD